MLIESQNPNQRDLDTSIHDIAVQRQVLLSKNLLVKVINSIHETGDPNLEILTLSSLRPMLKVVSVENSAILKLKAVGPQREILPIIVDEWIDQYVSMNLEMQKIDSDDTTESLRGQLEVLKNKIKVKQRKLEVFRDKYDIVSMTQDENRILSKLKGLNSSFNKATEKRITSEANLIVIKDAIEKGTWAGKYKKTTELERLELEADLLNEQVVEYKKRYKPQFIKRDKDARAALDKLTRLEKKIQIKYQELQTAAIENGMQEIKSALAAEKDLQKRILDYEKKASKFTERFSEHDSLKEDLLRLKNLNRDYQEKLVALEIKSDKDILQAKILERPFIPEASIYPDYLRDTGISIAAALILGVLGILLYDLIVRPAKSPTNQTGYSVTYNQLLQDPSIALQSPAYHQQKGMLLPQIEQRTPRELSVIEVKALYNHTDNNTGLLIAGLINGLTLEETARLKWGDISFETNELKTPDPPHRVIELSQFYRLLLEKNMSTSMDTNKNVLQNKKGEKIPIALLEEFISHAARQTQIEELKKITTLDLRHTYIAFLARQGLLLSEIEKRVGQIPTNYHAAYDIIRPPGTGVLLKNAKIDFPI